MYNPTTDSNEVSHRINAVVPLTLWVWQVLDANTFMDKITVTVEGKTGSIMPILPLSDEPLVSDSKKTYIVYGHVEQDPMDGYHRTGTIAFRIIAQTYSQLVQVANVISDVFETEDVAAAHINRWSSSNPDFIGIHFTSACVSYVEIGDPEAVEGGPVEGVVSVRYEYLRQPAPITLPA